MKIQMTETQFQVLAVCPVLLALILGFYWIPPFMLFFGVPKIAADFAVPAIFGFLYVLLRRWPSLLYRYCDLVQAILRRQGLDVQTK